MRYGREKTTGRTTRAVRRIIGTAAALAGDWRKADWVAPPALPTLASLAVANGFPKDCLGTRIDLFGIDPTAEPTSTDPNVEELDCIYSGHPEGQPAPSDPCIVTLERNKWTDPPNDFRASVPGTDGKTVYIGKNPQFSDIPTTPGVPPACDQENITYP